MKKIIIAFYWLSFFASIKSQNSIMRLCKDNFTLSKPQKDLCISQIEKHGRGGVSNDSSDVSQLNFLVIHADTTTNEITYDIDRSRFFLFHGPSSEKSYFFYDTGSQSEYSKRLSDESGHGFEYPFLISKVFGAKSASLIELFTYDNRYNAVLAVNEKGESWIIDSYSTFFQSLNEYLGYLLVPRKTTSKPVKSDSNCVKSYRSKSLALRDQM
ncbi:MAG: hypothetical protein H6Q14_2489 [Bacteroidetes bacterium]|nr:hypothetical protein [Bacteroidota bacterium]